MTPFAQLGEMEKVAVANSARARLALLLPKLRNSGNPSAVAKAEEFISRPLPTRLPMKESIAQHLGRISKSQPAAASRLAGRLGLDNLADIAADGNRMYTNPKVWDRLVSGEFWRRRHDINFRPEAFKEKLDSLQRVIPRRGIGSVALEDLKVDPAGYAWRGSEHPVSNSSTLFASAHPSVAAMHGQFIARTKSKDWRGGLPKFDDNGVQILPSDPEAPFYSKHLMQVDRDARLRGVVDEQRRSRAHLPTLDNAAADSKRNSPVYELVGQPLKPLRARWINTGHTLVPFKIKRDPLYARIEYNAGGNDPYVRSIAGPEMDDSLFASQRRQKWLTKN